MSAAVAGTTSVRPPRSYTTLWDVTHKAIAERDQERCVEGGDGAQHGDLSLAESVPELSLKPVHLPALPGLSYVS
jgi:hypothetical protein